MSPVAASRRDIVVIGASAGGVEALRTVIAALPATLPATVLVVLHVPASGGSVLPSILDRAGLLPAKHADPDEHLARGVIYVAPPDRHLVLRDDHVAVTRGPRENGHRPAVDVLFRSAARAAGARVIGVVLSGVLDDGTAGLASIKSLGGTTVVQDPTDALYPGMPRSAIAHVAVDHISRAEDIGALLTRLCTEEFEGPALPVPPLVDIETGLALMEDRAMNQADRPGRPSGFSCPDCNGVLWEIHDAELTRYRCRVGHAWSAESLLGEQTQQLEAALWMALRGLEEKAALARTMHDQAQERQNPLTARRFADQQEEALNAATLIRKLLVGHLGLSEDGDVNEATRVMPSQ